MNYPFECEGCGYKPNPQQLNDSDSCPKCGGRIIALQEQERNKMNVENEPKRLPQVAGQIQILESKLCQLTESLDSLELRLAAVTPEGPKVKQDNKNLVHEKIVLLAEKIRSCNERLLESIDRINLLISVIEL